MADDSAAGAAERYTPSAQNADLLQEALWIAEQTRVLRKPRRGETAWQADLETLGSRIGRTTGAFKALRSGGDPELLTLRRLLAYALEHIPGYSSVRFARACGLLHERDLLRYAASTATDITEEDLEESRRSTDLSEEDRDLLRDIAHVMRARRQRRDAAGGPGPSGPPSAQEGTAAPDAGAQQASQGQSASRQALRRRHRP